MDTPLVSYLVQAGRGQAPSGMRVLAAGQVELKQGGDWQQIAHLSPGQLAQLRAEIVASTLFELPAVVEAPPRLRADAVCVWEAAFDGRHAAVTVRGWSEEHPAAAPLRRLVNRIFDLTQAAQLGQTAEGQ